jgi:Uma2 family endonuclease
VWGVFGGSKLGLADDVFVYADASIVCGPLLLRPDTRDVVTNPTVVVEVLSRSTEGYDRGDKLHGYLALPSVRHVVLVSQRQVQIDVYTRHDDGSFRYESFGPGAALRLAHPPISLSLDALYAGVFDLPGDDETTSRAP